ncbi:MAG: porin [Rhodospirillales bacterium]|nr:porin [Rhodospirillales bacterium]
MQSALLDPARAPVGGAGTRLDGEAHIAIDGQTDTGVTYGGRLQLLRAAKPRDNGSYAEIAWAWGEFRLGDYGGAARELTVSAPTVGIGQIDGDLDRFGGLSALIAPYALNNDDSTKLTYLSPAVFGFRLGLSYTPELAGGGIEIVPARRIAGIDTHRNVTEIALGSTRDIGVVTVTSGASAVFGEARAGSHLHDLAGGAAGVKLAWNGLTLGSGFVYDGPGTLPLDRRPGHVGIESVVSEINLGLTYDIGHWSLGASWAHDYRKALPSSDIVSAGVAYRIVRGLTIGADLSHYSRPSGQGQGRGLGQIETTVLLAETALHF